MELTLLSKMTKTSILEDGTTLFQMSAIYFSNHIFMQALSKQLIEMIEMRKIKRETDIIIVIVRSLLLFHIKLKCPL